MTQELASEHQQQVVDIFMLAIFRQVSREIGSQGDVWIGSRMQTCVMQFFIAFSVLGNFPMSNDAFN